MFIAFVGREPELSIAELEAALGSGVVTPLSSQAVVLNTPALGLPFAHLGGTIKIAQHILTLDQREWKSIANVLLTQLEFCQLFDCGEDHTFNLGISVHGLKVGPRDITGLALDLKKKFRRESNAHRLRIVPNKQIELSSAQILHDHLAERKRGTEIVIIRGDDGKTYVGLTEHIQDIDAYSERDYGRPCRDARVGMLPPKLAQIIVNLTVGRVEDDDKISILDPFCGTGVLVQEALLMGHECHGADIDATIGDCYRRNMDWLLGKYPTLTSTSWSWQLADATTAKWQDTEFATDREDIKRVPLRFNRVASELYLGPPLEKLPSSSELDQSVASVNDLLKTFLNNVARQSEAGIRLCLAVPAWQISLRRFRTLPVLDQIDELGYTWAQFSLVNTRELFYARPDQMVGRQLVTLERK